MDYDTQPVYSINYFPINSAKLDFGTKERAMYIPGER